MIIKMIEHFQGSGQPTLAPGKEYDSAEISLPLCQWLIDHGKAVDVTPKPAVEPEKPEKPEENEPEKAPAENPPKKAAVRARKPRARAKK
jgi:hypothetical protein